MSSEGKKRGSKMVQIVKGKFHFVISRLLYYISPSLILEIYNPIHFVA